MSLITLIGKSLIFEVLQVFVGCLIAYGLYKLLLGKKELVAELNEETILLTILFSLLGIVLPMSIFGVIPILLAAVLVGLKLPSVIPILASNFIFNMLVPFTDVGFSWRTSWLRVAVAFVMGISAGILLKVFKIDNRHILKGDPDQSIGNQKNFWRFINQYMSLAGLYLIIGVILEVIFKEYFYYDFINIVNISSISAAVFGVIKGYDITTRVFIINMIIFNLIMNLKTLSGTLLLFKWKGTIGFYGFCGAWVVILCLVNIFF